MIGTAGPPVESSGFACFLEAARLVLGSGRDAEFLIATQGQDAIDLRRHAKSLAISDRVSVADFPVSGDQFWAVLNVYCQPSLVPSTGRMLVLALARGIPSIATGVQGLHALVEHGRTGIIVPADSPEALAAAIMEFLDDPAEAQLAGLRGQSEIRARFDLDIEADLLARLYRARADPKSWASISRPFRDARKRHPPVHRGRTARIFRGTGIAHCGFREIPR